jgi:Ca-activated chloride channel family protein
MLPAGSETLLGRAGAWTLLVLAAVLVPLWIRARRRGRRQAEAFTGGRLGPLLDAHLRSRSRAELAGILGLALCGLALLLSVAPRREDPREAGDLIVVLDVSRSMLAEDLTPTRLEVARARARELVEASRADRIGLVLVAGDVGVACPLTSDRNAFVDRVEAAAPGLVGEGGTALASGILEALGQLRVAAGRSGPDLDESRPAAAIVLLSDGEEQRSQERAREAARTAGRAGVPIFTFCTAGPEAVQLFGPGPDGRRVPVRGPDGRPLVTRGDPAMLEELSRLSGGGGLSASAPVEPLPPPPSRPPLRAAFPSWLLGTGLLLLLVEAVQRAGR